VAGTCECGNEPTGYAVVRLVLAQCHKVAGSIPDGVIETVP
jgi:hypothetical protein